jgi:hypothetical protein
MLGNSPTRIGAQSGGASFIVALVLFQMLLSRQNQAESLSKLAEAGLDLIHDEVTRCANGSI